MQRLTFEEALSKTIDHKNGQFGNIFQKIIVICAISSIMTGFVILGGISFLEKVPNKFECRGDSLSIIHQRNQNMTHVSAKHPHLEPIKPQGDWKQCSQQFICKNNLNLYKDLFRFDQTDPEYIDNWIQKFDLLCKPQEYIGLIGSCYLVGMFIGYFILPPNSDTYGRRPTFIVTMILSTIAQGVILFTSNIHHLFLFMIVLGTTFSGKNIVALNYAIECQPETMKNFVVSLYWFVELTSIILWSFYYQMLDKNWFPLQAVYFVVGIIAMFIAIFVLPESPRYLYSKQKFVESRASLNYIANFNGKKKMRSFLFDNEIETEEQKEKRRLKEQLLSIESGADANPNDSDADDISPEASDLEKDNEERKRLLSSKDNSMEKQGSEQNQSLSKVVIKQQLTEGQIFVNLVKMTVMWTAGSFNQFLLSAQMKYLEGNIFVNFYMFGGAGMVAVIAASFMYKKIGVKDTYIISYYLSMVGAIGIIIVEMNVFGIKDKQAKEKFEERLMPVIILFLKMGIIISFITTTQVSFTDDRIFPPHQRNTSVGTAGMIARSITIVAPIVNEWAAPFPILIMIFLLLCGLITSYSFPKDDEFTPGQAQKEFVYDLNGKKGSPSKNSEGKDENTDCDGNVTHLNLSQALKNDTSSEEITNANNKNPVKNQSERLPNSDQRTISGVSADQQSTQDFFDTKR